MTNDERAAVEVYFSSLMEEGSDEDEEYLPNEDWKQVGVAWVAGVRGVVWDRQCSCWDSVLAPLAITNCYIHVARKLLVVTVTINGFSLVHIVEPCMKKARDKLGDIHV